eukprot:gene21086-biopygen17743
MGIDFDADPLARSGVFTCMLQQRQPHGEQAAQSGTVAVRCDLAAVQFHQPLCERQADAQAALARFDGVVLKALRETETALSRYVHALDEQAQLAQAREQADQVAQDNHRLHESGRAPLLSQLEAQGTLTRLDQQVAQSQGQTALDEVALFLALGGGWQQQATQP